MFAKTKVWNLISVLAIAAALVGCSAAPTLTPTPTPLPTIDPKPTFDAISTQAAATVVANLTLTAPTVTPVTPTATTPPTNTPAPTDSDTPTVTATATKVFIPWTKTPTAEPVQYSCQVTSVSPKSSDTLKVDQDFDGKWTIKNTGTKTWDSGYSDFKFLSGTALHTGSALVDMTSDVAPNGTYTVTIDMKTPSGDGTFKTTWGLSMSEGTTCNLSLTINVTK